MVDFEDLIGYEGIKEKLKTYADMIKDPEPYRALGATVPRGILLKGPPGVGKTSLAMAFLKASEARSYILRKDTEHFAERMREVFFEATEGEGAAVILLDDIDTFGACEEAVLLKSLIDGLDDGQAVYLIATANDTKELPASLLRPGRLGEPISVPPPNDLEEEAIVRRYLAARCVDNVNLDDVAGMLTGRSFAGMDGVLNGASVIAARERTNKVEMRHIVSSFFEVYFGFADGCRKHSPRAYEEVCYHEAGHAVMAEALERGSFRFAACVDHCAEKGSGLVLHNMIAFRRPYGILASLAGKAAAELRFGRIASGTQGDLSKAFRLVAGGIRTTATAGLSSLGERDATDALEARQELIANAELERMFAVAREILCDNRSLLDAVAEHLVEHGYLLRSELSALIKLHGLVIAAVPC